MVSDSVMSWLASGKPALIGDVRLRPRPSPHLPGSVMCIQCGQADVLFANAEDGSGWVVKKFLPGKAPHAGHLESIAQLLPRYPGFRCGTDRRILRGRDLKKQRGTYFTDDLRGWLDGTVLMPEIHGNSWSTVAEDIRTGVIIPTLEQRQRLCASLSKQVLQLESIGCAHRDFSPGNVFGDPMNGETELIDFDGSFHKSLTMPQNTTCGTDGYMAPFLSNRRNGDIAKTWCPIADRFALSILNAEFLVTCKGSPQGNDGGLFPQDELCQRGGEHINYTSEFLQSEHPRAWPLFQSAIRSRSFSDCAPPQAWLDLYSTCSRAAKPAPSNRIPCLADLPTVQLRLPQIRPPIPVALPADPWKKAI